MGYSNLHNLAQIVTGGGAGGWVAGSGGAGASRHVLVQQKLEEWEWYARFIEMNPDVKERWEQHKTYEILKNEQLSER